MMSLCWCVLEDQAAILLKVTHSNPGEQDTTNDERSSIVALLDASRDLAAYWGRIANGASVVLMAVLALPFVLGGLRSAGTGARMILGLVIGLGYFVLVRLSAQIGEVFSLDPVVAAWAPGALLFAVTAFAVVRLR